MRCTTAPPIATPRDTPAPSAHPILLASQISIFVPNTGTRPPLKLCVLSAFHPEDHQDSGESHRMRYQFADVTHSPGNETLLATNLVRVRKSWGEVNVITPWCLLRVNNASLARRKTQAGV